MKAIGIIGQGFVGTAVNEGLTKHYNIETYDIAKDSTCNSLEELHKKYFVNCEHWMLCLAHAKIMLYLHCGIEEIPMPMHVGRGTKSKTIGNKKKIPQTFSSHEGRGFIRQTRAESRVKLGEGECFCELAFPFQPTRV